MATPIKDFGIDGIQKLVSEASLPSFRAMQLLSWIYEKNCSSYPEMTNLPKAMREQFESAYPLYSPKVITTQTSIDGSRKYLIEYQDGSTTETVAMPSDGRLSVCVSSQAGCAMGCAFCATGLLGLTRDLTPGEIVDQVTLVQSDFNRRVTNVVVMGQGEPLSNYRNVIAALRILNHPKLLNIGARHITISTCGLVTGIRDLSRETEQFTLAVSLHSARQEVRNTIMPRLSSQRIDDLRKALKKYAETTGRRFSFEYALMEGINDGNRDLDALIDYCKGLLCHVNLIPLNKVPGSSFQPVSSSMMKHWASSLEAANVAVSIRKSRGSDIDAACGQLAAQYR